MVRDILKVSRYKHMIFKFEDTGWKLVNSHEYPIKGVKLTVNISVAFDVGSIAPKGSGGPSEISKAVQVEIDWVLERAVDKWRHYKIHLI